MNKMLLICYLLTSVVLANAQEDNPSKLTGYYLGQKPPGNKPERFLPSILYNSHTSVVFSPDGNQVYWSEHDTIHMMEQEKGQWTSPRHLKFLDESMNEDVPFISPDGMRLYFYASFGVNDKQNRRGIWYVDRIGHAWTSPQSVGSEINNIFGHWQFSVSGKGTICFPSESGIMISRRVNGKYEKPAKLLKDIAGFPYISPNEDYLIFASALESDAEWKTAIYICYMKRDGSWTDYINISKRMGYNNFGQVCPIVSPDGKYMFFLYEGVWWVDATFIEELGPKE